MLWVPQALTKRRPSIDRCSSQSGPCSSTLLLAGEGLHPALLLVGDGPPGGNGINAVLDVAAAVDVALELAQAHLGVMGVADGRKDRRHPAEFARAPRSTCVASSDWTARSAAGGAGPVGSHQQAGVGRGIDANARVEFFIGQLLERRRMVELGLGGQPQEAVVEAGAACPCRRNAPTGTGGRRPAANAQTTPAPGARRRSRPRSRRAGRVEGQPSIRPARSPCVRCADRSWGGSG